ncbi:MAG: hypothetical protein ACRD0S_06575 [Acidimicrobiales bacterium]
MRGLVHTADAHWRYNAATPHARIDYVMSSGNVVARTAAVVTTDASDHLPVVADLALPGKKLSP